MPSTQTASMRRCIVEDCGNHDPTKGCMVHYHNRQFGPLACEYGRFATSVTERFGHLGNWKFRNVRQYGEVLVATLSGKYGRVEIWGGSIHGTEVWAIPKGTSGCLISTRLTDDAVEMACGRARIQKPLDLAGDE